ncbi:hypothetical protein CPB97_002032 [Podila verticillata]|nr:hypothetical protein CPB97_002032 [Podila verticillata]
MSPSSLSSRPSPCFPPEILVTVGQYLTPQDAASCICVSKHWHNVFVPILWRSLDDIELSNIQGCQEKHGHPYFCACKVEASRVLLKFGEHIRHLKTSCSLTTAVLASAPDTCWRLCSLTVRNKGDLTFSRGSIIRIMSELRKGVWGVKSHKFEELFGSCPSLHDYVKSRRHFHSRIIVQLVLQNASTLTRLHFENQTQIMDCFKSLGDCYKFLAKLPHLSDLQVPGEEVSIVALKQTVPRLTHLYLTAHKSMIGHQHGNISGLLETTTGTALEGPYSSEASTLWPFKSLSLDNSATFAELDQILQIFPTIERLSVARVHIPSPPQHLAPGVTREPFRNIKFFQSTRCGQRKAMALVLTIIVALMPNLETLVLPGQLYDCFSVHFSTYPWLYQRCPHIVSIRLVKYFPLD